MDALVPLEPTRTVPGRKAHRALRPARFVAIGAGSALLQLGLLAALHELANLGSASNAVAFFLSGQVNFALNRMLTWGDRVRRPSEGLAGQVFWFNVLLLVAVAFNQAVYLVALRAVPYLLAGAIGIGATTLAKYFAADRWIFRTARHRTEPAAPDEETPDPLDRAST